MGIEVGTVFWLLRTAAVSMNVHIPMVCWRSPWAVDPWNMWIMQLLFLFLNPLWGISIFLQGLLVTVLPALHNNVFLSHSCQNLVSFALLMIDILMKERPLKVNATSLFISTMSIMLNLFFSRMFCSFVLFLLRIAHLMNFSMHGLDDFYFAVRGLLLEFLILTLLL